MFERIHHMLIKEFIQVFRDPRMKGVIFIMPIVQLLIFGYAVTTDIRNVSIAVYDLDNTVTSRDFISRFVESGYFEIKKYINSEKQINALMDYGEVRAILRINNDFEGKLLAGRTARIQLILDGTDTNTVRIILDYSTRIIRKFSQQILISRITRIKGSVPNIEPVTLQSRAWFNENLESRNFFVPGVIATLVSLVTLLLTSMAIVREKEIGTMEQIIVTPITQLEFILGKTVPFALISFFDVILITIVGVLWFGVPIRGNLLLLFFATTLYLMTTLGVGLFISTISTTQQQAMMSTFFFFFPAMLLSGFMFPIANMPKIIQWFTYLNPLRYFLVIIRGIFLKGVGFNILWTQLLPLAVMGSVILWLSSRRFKKTLQ